MALTILDKEKFGTFKLDEKVLQKTTDRIIKKNKEAAERIAKEKANGTYKEPRKKQGYISNF